MSFRGMYHDSNYVFGRATNVRATSNLLRHRLKKVYKTRTLSDSTLESNEISSLTVEKTIGGQGYHKRKKGRGVSSWPLKPASEGAVLTVVWAAVWTIPTIPAMSTQAEVVFLVIIIIFVLGHIRPRIGSTP